MGITLNKNSWHFKYYSSMVSHTPPKSLCPYFWTMVLLILISPIIGIIAFVDWIGKHATNLIDYIRHLFRSQKPEVEKPKKSIEQLIAEMDKKHNAEMARVLKWNRFSDYVSKFFKWVFFPAIGLFTTYTLCVGAYDAGWFASLMTILVVFGVVGFILGVVYLIETYGSMMGRRLVKFLQFINPLNWKVIIVIGEMIKTAYTKACPLITWEGVEENETKSHTKAV